MVLTRAMEKIQSILNQSRSNTTVHTARMEVCLEELCRTFQIEVDSL